MFSFTKLKFETVGSPLQRQIFWIKPFYKFIPLQSNIIAVMGHTEVILQGGFNLFFGLEELQKLEDRSIRIV